MEDGGWGGADGARGEDDALSEGGGAGSDTWRTGRLMALKTSTATHMTGRRKQRGGEIKDASKGGSHESKKRTPRRHETLSLLATGTCSPRGCPTAALVLTGAADWTGLIKHA